MGLVEATAANRWDRRASAMAGGDSGDPAIVAGDSSSSELIRRLLTKDSDDFFSGVGGGVRHDVAGAIFKFRFTVSSLSLHQLRLADAVLRRFHAHRALLRCICVSFEHAKGPATAWNIHPVPLLES